MQQYPLKKMFLKVARDIERLASEAIMDEENTADRVYISMDPETFRRLEELQRY